MSCMTAEEMAARRWAKVPPGPERTKLARKAALTRWAGHVKQAKPKPRKSKPSDVPA